MKKYLMTGVAALALCAGFVGCSKDDDVYDPNAADQLVVSKYNAAFIQAFGEPAANQEWGFGKNTSAARSMTRTIQPTFNFPSDADASKFLDDVPAGVNSYAAECEANNQTDGYGRGTSYVDPSWTGQVNIWGAGTPENNYQDASGGVLYIKGDNDFTNRYFYVAGNTEIYLVKNAVLRLSSTSAAGLMGDCKFYLADGAKIVTAGELVLNNGLHIYNHGTIEANKLHANSNSVLYNKGTVTVDTRISVENNLSVIVNDGTITAADLNTAGSGKFQNNGSVTISGTTFVNSNDNTWVNNGQYQTKNYIYFAASDEVINNCKLIVEDNFLINLADNDGSGNFKMDAGSSVVTKNFYGGGNWAGMAYNTYVNAQGGPFYIYMGAGSVFKVTETATMNASKENYGIYGPESGDYAVFQAKNVVMGKANQGFEVTYGGNLAVVAENHFANGNDGQEDHPFIDFKDNAVIYAPGFTAGLPAINIAETECNPGFKGESTPNPAIRIFVEDLSAGENEDFDFNDAVLDVEYISETEAKITLWAAGGTLPLQICSKDGSTYGGGFEVHKAFGVNTKCMVNTHAYPEIKDVAGYYSEDGLDPVVAKITLPENIAALLELNDDEPTTFDRENFAWSVKYLIRLEVLKDKWYILDATKGNPACKVAGPTTDDGSKTDWGIRWMLERHDIKGGYTNFKNYVNTGYPTDWWSTGVNNDVLYSKNHEPKGFTVECDEVAPHKK